jgi:hypothetical protein
MERACKQLPRSYKLWKMVRLCHQVEQQSLLTRMIAVS